MGRRLKTDIETDLFKDSKLICFKVFNVVIVLNTHLN